MSFRFSGSSVSYNTKGKGVKLPPEEEDPLRPMRKAFRNDPLFANHGDMFGTEEDVLREIDEVQSTGLLVPDRMEPSIPENADAETHNASQESFVEAYQDLPVPIAEKIRGHRYLRFAEGGLEDLTAQFETYEDLIFYLRKECGLEMDYAIQGMGPGVNPGVFDLQLRFVSHEVQKSEMEQKALGIGQSDILSASKEAETDPLTTMDKYDLFATQGGGENVNLRALFEADTEDDMYSVVEDFVRIVVFIEKHQNYFTVQKWKVEYIL